MDALIGRTDLGNTGVQVSAFCLGTMMFAGKTEPSEAARILHRALDLGIDFIDTAAMYEEGRTEETVGRAISSLRHKMILATKVHRGVTRTDILGSAEESLRRLRTDYIDLFQIHWPRVDMDVFEVMGTLNRLVRSGKARFVGCCNYPAYLMAECNGIAAEMGWAKLVSFQPPYNLLERGVEIECLPYCHSRQIAVIPYRPLCMGLLAGRYRRGESVPDGSRGRVDERIARWLELYGEGVERLEVYSRSLRVPMLAVALAWVRSNPAVTAPIVGVSSLAQLEECASAMSFILNDAERVGVSSFFDTDVKEVAGGDFPRLRRTLGLLASKERQPDERKTEDKEDIRK